MTDRSELVKRAEGLRKQAEREDDPGARALLVKMADSYAHLAESQSWSEAHPASVGALTGMLTKQD